MNLRFYQVEIALKAVEIVKQLNIVYITAEVRTGKTLMALETCKLLNCKSVLFLTKKKATESILSDYRNFNYSFDIDVQNDENLHNIEGNYDIVIHDEHHRFGSFPKPSERTKLFKSKFGHLRMIFLSGTPTPESYSQIYHQYFVSNYTPFKQYVNFYKWANVFVNKKQKYLSYGIANDYSEAKNELIEKITNKYKVTITQKEAGFTTEVKENILYCDMSAKTYDLIARLKRDSTIQGKNEVILADSGVKMMQKIHQMYSGTVKFESGNSQILDTSKADYIKQYFKGKKIAIFYKFKEELNLLNQVFNNELAIDLEEFNTTDKNIAYQIVTGREGISLAKAEYLVYLNIDFSATSYWQSRDRLTTQTRSNNNIFWIFATNGIESKIYKSVMNKKNYTLSNFKKDVGI